MFILMTYDKQDKTIRDQWNIFYLNQLSTLKNDDNLLASHIPDRIRPAPKINAVTIVAVLYLRLSVILRSSLYKC